MLILIEVKKEDNEMGATLENMRDCVKMALENGSQRGQEFKVMRHAIVVEMKRLGFDSSQVKDKLLNWNEKCEKKLAANEQKRQLLDYVDWVDKHECKIGCAGLEEFCLGKDKCAFYTKKLYFNRKAVEKLPFDIDEARKFLETRYKAEGYVMSLILKNLRRYQLEQGTGELMLIGYRKIASLIRDNDGHILDSMTILRRINDLVSEGMIEIAIKGKRGTFNNQANGYRFTPWKQAA